MFEPTIAQLHAVGGELVVVGLDGNDLPSPPTGLRGVPVRDADMLRLRLAGVKAAAGSIVAIGEDHSVPAPDWAEAVLRAHTEHPSAPAVVGCLVNAADRSISGRANFLAFAGSYAPPMPDVPKWRPPPLSTLSLKRTTLTELDDRPGGLDALANRLFADNLLVADDRIVVHHDQDLGTLGSIRNAYIVTRSAYGYAIDREQPGRRSEAARWAARHLGPTVWRTARAAQPSTPSRVAELAIVAAMAAANSVGAVLGAVVGFGRAPAQYE